MYTHTIDIQKLNEYKNKKLVKCQFHPERDLIIWNYTETVQMHGPWDDITTLTRGLITDKNGVIKGRSFRKFHNIEQGLHTPTESFRIYEKVDGSLGILFWHEDTWIFCSRGSFTSDQAKMGAYLLKTKYTSYIDSLDKNAAYSFEIVYPENRIVVNYNDREELVFLAAFDIKSGVEILDSKTMDVIKRCGFACATYFNETGGNSNGTNSIINKTNDFSNLMYLKSLNWDNCEGFVVAFDNGDRVKIKFENYLTLHKKMTNINGLVVWKWFSSSYPNLALDDWITKEGVPEGVPDEMYDWVKEKWEEYEKAYEEIYTDCNEEFKRLNTEYGVVRAEFAKRAAKHKYAKILFDMYNDSIGTIGIVKGGNGVVNSQQIIFDKICTLIKPKNGIMDVPYSGKLKDVILETLHYPPSITILVGISGSGKSSWANEYIKTRKNVVIVSRDAIRKNLYGYNDITINEYYIDIGTMEYIEREKMVTTMEYAMIETALKCGKDIIIDNTNVKKAYIQQYLKTFIYNDIHFKFFDVDVETCIERDAMRYSPVGEYAIRKQSEMKEQLMNTFDFEKIERRRKVLHRDIYNNKYNHIQREKCYVFDIDGTLADNSGRSPYDWSKVGTDKVFEHVKSTLVGLRNSGYKIVICTGRDGCCEDATKTWLVRNGIEWDMFYCRVKGDTRPDWVVKEEMWTDIVKTYEIVAMFDDRDSVVRHARFMGFNVYQVNYGDF